MKFVRLYARVLQLLGSEARLGWLLALANDSRAFCAQLLAADPTLESRPTFLFFKGAAQGIFAEGAEKLRAGVDDLQAVEGISAEMAQKIYDFFHGAP